MNNSKFRRVVCGALVAMLLIGVLPVMALASDFNTAVTGDYFAVISEDRYNLCSGATEVELVLNNADGNDRKVVHYFEVDTKNENIEVLPGYYGIDKLDPNNLALDGVVDKAQYWKAMELTKTVEYYEKMGYNVVGAMNTALAYDSNAPYGYMVMNGVVLGTPDVHKGAQTYLAIDAEGNCELRSMSQPLDGSEVTAISANFNWLVKDGELYSYKTVERTSSDASRSMIGIKADGTLIFCQVDGRNAPVSTGLSNYEMGEMMLALGCVNAVNCDGGGSSTFVSKREGETTNTMRSVPSDGSERPTINSAIIVSKAKATGEFDHAVLKTEYTYYAPGSAALVIPTGVDAAGSPAEMPTEGITWGLKDNSFGTIADGKFVSNGKKGVVTIQMFYNGALAGEKTIHVVDPDKFALTLDETVLPYGKTMTIDFACTYGADDWEVCVDGAYTLTLSDPKAATLMGNTLIATSDESILGVNVVATYTPNPAVTDVLKVTYGKGSEIVWDFEDGTTSNFLGADEMYDWAEENGASAPIQNDGNYSPLGDSFTFLSTDVVRNGNYSLGVTLDYTDAEFAGWSYNMFFYVGDSVVLRDVANGKNATTFGMWVYIPEGAAGMAMQIQGFKNPNGTGGTGGHFYFTTASGAKKNLNSCTEADIPESRWVYATVDLVQFGDYFATYNPYGTNGREPSFIRFYVKPTVAANLTFYYDDFTLDYSSAVDDRVLPSITNPTYTTADEGVALSNGAVINGNTITFAATVSDNIKLDNATGKIYVDGNLLPNSGVSGKFLVADAVTLTPGAHTVTFEIKDTMGNLAVITRTFTVAGTADVTLGGHNDSGLMPEYGSVYYVDINTTNISNVTKLTATLKLQTANTWEPIGTVVANGFKFSYELNQVEGYLTITIERNGEAVDASATTLASIPVRLWTWDGVEHPTDTPVAPEAHYKTGYCPIVRVQCSVVASAITYADNAKVLGSFNGKIDVETKINDIVYAWHYHDAELTVLNKDATCTEDGYANRTYCETCQSVVDWGTIYKATGHTYEVVGGKLACDCGEAVTSSGLLTIGGNIYYAVAGKLSTGWVVDGSNYYYFSTSNYAALTSGTYRIGGYNHTFDENGVLIAGQWVRRLVNGEYRMSYVFAGQFVNRRFFEIDGKTYWFGEDDLMATKTLAIRITTSQPLMIYVIGEDGVVAGLMPDGIHEFEGKTYLFKDGTFSKIGAFEYNGSIYFANTSTGEIVTDKVYVVNETNNGLLNNGFNYFNADGTLCDNQFRVIDGKTYLMVKGQVAKIGVFEYDGKLYYANSDGGAIATGKTYVIAADTNGLVKAGYNYFNADGSLCDNEFWSDGTTKYFMVDGQPAKLGVFEFQGSIYFASKSNGAIQTGEVYVTVDDANGLVEAGKCFFEADGKLAAGGFVTMNGNLYYMVGGKIAKLGVFELNGKLYYANSDSGVIATGKTYIIAADTNGLVKAGYNYFNADGTLCDNEFVTVDGNLYFMVGGQIAKLGVFEFEGAKYYANSDTGIIATEKTYVVVADTNGLIGAGFNYFAEDGKLMDKVFYEINGNTYYMVNGQVAMLGVFEHEGKLYYGLTDGGAIQTGKVYVIAADTNGKVKAGWNYFHEDGALYDHEFFVISGKTYYMINGQVSKPGIFEHEGNYYYGLTDGGAIQTGKVYVIANDTNGLVNTGFNYFHEDGRLYNREFLEINGKTYYMVMGQVSKAGLFEHEGDLYYALTDGGAVQTGKVYVIAGDTNGLVKAGWNYFDENGKLMDKVFYEIDGKTYYMVNGQIAKLGVFEHEGGLYYAKKDGGEVMFGKVYMVESDNNGLTGNGWIYTDANGRIYNNEFVTMNGKTYYMVAGQIAKLGVFELDGNLYYADIWSGEVAVGTSVYVPTDSTNDLIIHGMHTFDATGKMTK